MAMDWNWLTAILLADGSGPELIASTLFPGRSGVCRVTEEAGTLVR